MNKISIIIPAYNEAAGIGKVVEAARLLSGQNEESEVIVVNDGSTDATADLAFKAGAVVISNPHNMGYGFSLKRGFKQAKNECVVMVDADGTYPLERISDMVMLFDQGFDMVVGARQGKEYYTSNFKRFARFIFKWMSEFVVGKKIPDINSGLRVVRRSKILPHLHELSNTFSFTTSSTLVFFLQYYFVTYLPVAYFKRSGSSKVRYGRDALRTLQIMVDIIACYNPIKLFLLLSFLPTIFLLVSLFGVFVRGTLFWRVGAFASFFLILHLISLGCLAVMFRKK